MKENFQKYYTPAQEEIARKELRQLRISNANLIRQLENKTLKITQLETTLKEQTSLIKILETKITGLETTIEKLTINTQSYQTQIFKYPILKQPKPENGKTLGGQKGHKGYSKEWTKEPDIIKEIYYEECPHCHEEISTESQSYDSHFVEDIPIEKLKPEITEYRIKRQWCSNCKKNIIAIPSNVIPFCRYGINTLILVMISKYHLHQPYNKISEQLKTIFKLEISNGGIKNLLKKGKIHCKTEYDNILQKIRGAPIKHADETTWKINGQTNWLWAFLTEESNYFTIEGSRGKKIVEKILPDPKTNEVLVHDDYGAYQSLNYSHQSCWAHLLRKARDYSNFEGASQEIKELKIKLDNLYKEISDFISTDPDIKSRQEKHKTYLSILEDICKPEYKNEDAKRVITRIKNQKENLLTCVLIKGVPMTNNLAERAIRPSVINRKISGGSRSLEGSQMHAVNMSVIQTLNHTDGNLFDKLKNTVLESVVNNTRGNGE